MADDTPKAPEAEKPAEAPVPEPVAEPEAAPVSSIQYDANVGSVVAPSPVTYPPNNTARVHETSLQADRPAVAGDPEFIKVKHLGASDPAPLPLAGANGKLRKPEDVFSGDAEA